MSKVKNKGKNISHLVLAIMASNLFCYLVFYIFRKSRSSTEFKWLRDNENPEEKNHNMHRYFNHRD